MSHITCFRMVLSSILVCSRMRLSTLSQKSLVNVSVGDDGSTPKHSVDFLNSCTGGGQKFVVHGPL